MRKSKFKKRKYTLKKPVARSDYGLWEWEELEPIAIQFLEEHKQAFEQLAKE